MGTAANRRRVYDPIAIAIAVAVAVEVLLRLQAAWRHVDLEQGESKISQKKHTYHDCRVDRKRSLHATAFAISVSVGGPWGAGSSGMVPAG